MNTSKLIGAIFAIAIAAPAFSTNASTDSSMTQSTADAGVAAATLSLQATNKETRLRAEIVPSRSAVVAPGAARSKPQLTSNLNSDAEGPYVPVAETNRTNIRSRAEVRAEAIEALRSYRATTVSQFEWLSN